MWDCKHRRSGDDFCSRRGVKCFPGGSGCVLEGKYIFPNREELDFLLRKKKSKQERSDD